MKVYLQDSITVDNFPTPASDCDQTWLIDALYLASMRMRARGRDSLRLSPCFKLFIPNSLVKFFISLILKVVDAESLIVFIFFFWGGGEQSVYPITMTVNFKYKLYDVFFNERRKLANDLTPTN